LDCNCRLALDTIVVRSSGICPTEAIASVVVDDRLNFVVVVVVPDPEPNPDPIPDPDSDPVPGPGPTPDPISDPDSDPVVGIVVVDIFVVAIVVVIGS